MPTSLSTVREFLESFAPIQLAEAWDNVGLLVGRHDLEIRKVMTCLTVTPESADEAIRDGASLIVTHHPIPFRPVKTINDDTVTGQILLNLIAHGVAVYSPHTCFDSARGGINQQLAEALSLSDVRSFRPCDESTPAVGAGRFGKLDDHRSVQELAEKLKRFLSVNSIRLVGVPDQKVLTIGVACGSAGQFIDDARREACELLITGETSFHNCLEAKATGIVLLLTGHYASERFAVETLADRLAEEFAEIEVWASRHESDPLSLI